MGFVLQILPFVVKVRIYVPVDALIVIWTLLGPAGAVTLLPEREAHDKCCQVLLLPSARDHRPAVFTFYTIGLSFSFRLVLTDYNSSSPHSHSILWSSWANTTLPDVQTTIYIPSASVASP